MFLGFLISKGIQSATIKSYLSAIKKILVADKYKWDDSRVLISALTKACRLVNDTVYTRLPIQCGFLEQILFELERIFQDQWYLEIMYKTLFILGYYGLMRVGEVTDSPHVLKAKDANIAVNKEKILLILYSSKTHDRSKHPQQIKITSNRSERSGAYRKRHFCPFKVFDQYRKLRGDYVNNHDNFFVFRDGTPVTAENARKTLKLAISRIGLQD